jgi:hypothetical protein
MIRAIVGIGAIDETLRMPQERSSRGGPPLRYPPFFATRIGPEVITPWKNVRDVEDDVDAATPVDAQNAPTGVWKSRKEREIPTAPTSIILFL